MGFGGLLDFVFFLYFFTHIPITILVDSQSLLPKTLYPKELTDLLEWYCREFKDSMMMDPPIWFKSFCACELVVQFPFFFVATYAFFKGFKRNTWIRVPAIVYSTHVATTVVAILAHILYTDFSGSKFPGPSTDKERMTLCAIYFPYLLVPVLILLRMLFTTEHLVHVGKQKRH